jgi:hypothetical protein
MQNLYWRPTGKTADLEVKVEKTKYMVTSCHQTTGQTFYIKVANKSFENVWNFKYLGHVLTNQNAFTSKLRAE